MAALFMQISVRFLLMCLTPGTNVADEDASIFVSSFCRLLAVYAKIIG